MNPNNHLDNCRGVVAIPNTCMPNTHKNSGEDMKLGVGEEGLLPRASLPPPLVLGLEIRGACTGADLHHHIVKRVFYLNNRRSHGRRSL